MKEILIKMLKEQVENLKKLYVENKAYTLFINYLNENQDIKSQFSNDELNTIFPEPAFLIEEKYTDSDEDNIEYTGSEWTVNDDFISVQNFDDIGWLTDKITREKLYQDIFYLQKVLPSIGNMPKEVKDNIQLNSTHILGRCNNPNDWGLNKQGLVYGMVQSGKTASMITLMGLAQSSGYRIFIILAGDKTSLREQTQKRIDVAFDLNIGGYPNKHKFNVRSLTKKGYDYSDAAKNLSNGLDLWDIKDVSQTIIICIKKETNNLNKLLEHLKEIENNCNLGGRYSHIANFKEDFKTLILDDEADYASQDTRPKKGGATIHNDIVALRNQLPQNCYVAYTATPQACIGANPNKLVGYPSDFIWLIDPHKDDYGNTTSYLGLEEYFEHYPSNLIKRLPDTAWPYIEKDDITGKKIGVRNPGNNELDSDALLTAIEREFITDLIENTKSRKNNCAIYIDSLIEFLITCSIRWHRHYLKCKDDGFFKDGIKITDIEAIEKRGEKFTEIGYKPFPYHAMMFNLSYLTDCQKNIVELVEILIEEVKSEWNVTKNSKNKSKSKFVEILAKQNEKSFYFRKNIIEFTDIEIFIEFAILITTKKIQGNDKYIYLLNSKDEGLTLQYDNQVQEGRPKKSSIIVGGNILSRGLTIENLSTTVFARSQVMSLGDTNLQMCRWFGHKRDEIDLQTVYLQEHSQVLFQTISESDRELRIQFRKHIFNSTPSKCLLLSLFNSPLFKNTSPTKSKFLQRGSQESYSGINIDMLEPFKHIDFLKNNSLLNDFTRRLNDLNYEKINSFKRADVYKNVDPDLFISFFQNLHYSEDAMNISPFKYCNYITKWRENKPIPQINIAIFGTDDIPKNRARKVIGNIMDFKSEDDLKSNVLKRLAPFRGGKSSADVVKMNIEKSYCGDHFIDMSLDFHITNYTKKNLRRDSSMPILFLFYKINANYLGLYPIKGKPGSKPVVYNSTENNYIKSDSPVLTFSIATPLGGPIFQTQENKLVINEVLNNDECINFFENLNNNG